MTRTTLAISAIAAVFVIASFISVLIVHSVVLFIRLLLIATVAFLVISTSRLFSARAVARQGPPK